MATTIEDKIENLKSNVKAYTEAKRRQEGVMREVDYLARTVPDNYIEIEKMKAELNIEEIKQ